MAKRPSVSVSGHGGERCAPTLLTGVVIAQTRASRPGAPPGTWYVRDETGTVRYHVVLHDCGRLVTTKPPDAPTSGAQEQE